MTLPQLQLFWIDNLVTFEMENFTIIKYFKIMAKKAVQISDEEVIFKSFVYSAMLQNHSEFLWTEMQTCQQLNFFLIHGFFENYFTRTLWTIKSQVQQIQNSTMSKVAKCHKIKTS